MQLTLILKITTAQGVKTSVTVKTHSDDHFPPTYQMTPGPSFSKPGEDNPGLVRDLN